MKTDIEQAEKIYNDIIKPYREIITKLEQRNRELVEFLKEVSGDKLSKLHPLRLKAKELLSKHSAPAGQKGGENSKKVCPNCENPYPHIHKNGQMTCDECNYGYEL